MYVSAGTAGAGPAGGRGLPGHGDPGARPGTPRLCVCVCPPAPRCRRCGHNPRWVQRSPRFGATLAWGKRREVA